MRNATPDDLTPRQHDVAKLITEGLSNKLIAAALNISEHTAQFHVNAIINKLGASTRVQVAVMYALWQAGVRPPARVTA